MKNAYVGVVGSIFPFFGPSSLSISGGPKVSFEETMSKKKAFVGKTAPRIWECGMDSRYPSEVAGLQWLAEFGKPPFVWYPVDAVIGNALSPSAAALAPGAHDGLEGPMVEVEPGVWLKSALPDSTGAVSLPLRSGQLDPLPVIPGTPLTVSVWLRGEDTRITVAWRDLSGSVIDSSSPSPVSRASLVRVSRTLTPPPGAVQATFILRGTQVAGPTVSFTTAVTPYSPGKGCKRAVIHDLSEALGAVGLTSSSSSFQFTVSEVG